MNAKETPRLGSYAVLLALFSCVSAEPLLAQQKDYQEAHVYITAPVVPPATAEVSPAVEVIGTNWTSYSRTAGNGRGSQYKEFPFLWVFVPG